jgi:hypothetical protein
MTRSLLLISTVLVFAAISPATAQDTPAKETAKPAAKTESVLKKEPAAKATENTPVKKWIDAENAVIDKLKPREQETFLLIREKYSIIKTIGIAERDIGDAVKSCGKNNPGMKDKMQSRFKQWQDAVNPIITAAEKNLDNELNSQKVVEVSVAKNIFKLQDEAYAYNEKMTTKQVVTTAEACQGLLDSMDRTEDNMITLLEKTLLPESVIRQQYERGQKEKMKAEAEAKKKESATEKNKTE